MTVIGCCAGYCGNYTCNGVNCGCPSCGGGCSSECDVNGDCPSTSTLRNKNFKFDIFLLIHLEFN